MWHNKIKFLFTLLLSMSLSLLAQSTEYIGDFKDGKRSGLGTLIFSNGAKYVGEFKEGKQNGIGVLYGSDGLIVNNGIWANGEFRLPIFSYGQSNLPACKGDIRWWNKCIGTYSWKGPGVIYKYYGQFVDGQYDGLGTLYKDDVIEKQGLWRKDNFITSQYVSPPTTNSLIGTGIDNERKKLEEEKRQLTEELQKANKNILWSDRVSQVVAGALKKWLEESGTDLKEIPSPAFPPSLKLSQEVWESNKEFEGRVTSERTKRQREIDSIQSEYKSKVDQRNAQIQQINAARLEKERSLSAKRKEYLGYALAAINLQISSKAVSFDQERAILYVDLSINNGKNEKYAYQNAPIEIRKTALTNLSNLSFKPDFFITDTGEFGIKNITAQVGQDISLGSFSQSDSFTQPLRVATIDVPVTSQVPLTQQSALVVDRNQVEQILYRDENESLRKRLEDLKRTQEQTLADQSKKASEEITKLKAEAEALKLQQGNVQQSRPINYGRTLVAHALVIGNSAYSGGNDIPNPVNDAKAISQKLRSLGFNVTEAKDTSRASMVTALSKFSQTAANADITLLFYAGHGVQISGTNYMLPIDINLQDVSQIPLQGVSLNSVVEQYLPGKTKLVFLDACRDNPLMKMASRGVTRGLAPINVSEGTLIAYSTKDGSTADDGVGKNSPFTTALLAHLDDPDDIAVVLRKVRENVMQITNNKQQPWEYGSLTGGALVLSAIKQK